MKKLKWTKQLHPIWGNTKASERNIFSNFYFPEFQWKADKFSIIYPRPASSHETKKYELYDGDEIYIFNTLKEAKDHALELWNKG